MTAMNIGLEQYRAALAAAMALHTQLDRPVAGPPVPQGMLQKGSLQQGSSLKPHLPQHLTHNSREQEAREVLTQQVSMSAWRLIQWLSQELAVFAMSRLCRKAGAVEVQPMRAHPIAGISERECLSPERVSKESFKHMTFRDPFQDKAYVTSIWFVLLQLSCL